MGKSSRKSKLKWYHSFPTINKKGSTPINHQMALEALIPKDLTGKTVLDLGAGEGYYSYIAAKRNAKVVVAIDNLENEKRAFKGDELTMYEKYKITSNYFKSNINFIPMNVCDIDKILMDFDIIFCFGLYYHLKNPYDMFEKCYKKCKDLLLVEGETCKGDLPFMLALGEYELNNDPSNYWLPTRFFIPKMLTRIGFKRVEIYQGVNEEKEADRCFYKCYKEYKEK